MSQAKNPFDRFARLYDWEHDHYRADVDVQAKLPVLSTYLGHVDPKSTYWYLSAAPELLALVCSRLQHALEVQP